MFSGSKTCRLLKFTVAESSASLAGETGASVQAELMPITNPSGQVKQVAQGHIQLGGGSGQVQGHNQFAGGKNSSTGWYKLAG
jgi:hypothetical protein